MTKIITAYAEDNDMTFILEETDRYTAVVGFYYGCPNERDTQEYYGKIIANYDIAYTDFCDDEEKMKDFAIMSKEDFFASYSYLTEEEYDLTFERLKNS